MKTSVIDFINVWFFTEVICEGYEAKLSCGSPDKSIRILSAFYGRRDSNTCTHATSRDWVGECRGEGVGERIRGVCDGRMFCYVGAYDNLGDDPCPGVYKYIEVEYVCEGK